VYPYRNRWRWIVFGRYSHLVRAIRDHRTLLDDPVLRQRVNSLRSWNLVRFIISIPLTVGVLATAASAVSSMLPDTAAERAFGDLVAIITGTTGLLTVLYLFLTRLLGQLEIDILAMLTIEQH
jgi:hypothetical protein